MSEKKYGTIKGATFAPNELKAVAPAPAPDDPPLVIGDRCALNSGGPSLLVVDEIGDMVIVSFPDGRETELHRATVRRA